MSDGSALIGQPPALGMGEIWLFDWMGQLVGESPFGKLLSYLSPLGHFDNLVKGLVDTKDLVYFAAAIIFSLFLTHRVIESQRWR